MVQNEIKHKITKFLTKKGKKSNIEKYIKNLYFNIKITNKQQPNKIIKEAIKNSSPKLINKQFTNNVILKILPKRKQINNGLKIITKNIINKKKQFNKFEEILNTTRLKKTEIYKLAEKVKYNKIHK